MSSDVKELFGCPFCGYRVSTTEASCPRCGSKFTDDTMFECPFCGDMVSPGSKKCPSCHVDFAEFLSKSQKKMSHVSMDKLLMDIINLESSQIKQEQRKIFSCPNCSWMLDGTEDKCPRCGTDFAEDSAFQCPICGAFVDPDASKCVECGAVFAGAGIDLKQEAAEQHEEMSSALTELLSSAGHVGPLPEIRKPEPPPEPGLEQPPGQAPSEPEPIEVPEPEQIVETQDETAPESEEIAEEPEVIEEDAVRSAGTRKVRRRRLKAKPRK